MLGIYAGYLVLVNVLLWSGGLGWLLHEMAPPLRLETGRSYSLWFFRVELRDLHLSAMDSSLHLELEVPRGSVQVRPTELASSTFATSHVRGEAFVFRLRPNYASLPEARRSALPNLADASKPLIDEPTRPEDLWGYDFRGLDVEFSELWISEYRYVGSARIRGGFRLHPQRSLAIYESDIELSEAALHFGLERKLADPFRAKASVEVPEVRFGEEVPWPEVRLEAEGKGKVLDLDVLEAYLSDGEPWRMSGGPLSLEWEGQVRDDRVAARLDLATARVLAAKGETNARAEATLSGRWEGRASEIPAGQLLDGFVDARGVELHHPQFDVDDWSFRLDFPRLTFERSPWSLKGPLYASAEDARPVVRLLGVPDLPPPLARFLQLPDLGVVGYLEATEQAQAFSIERATSDSMDITGEVVRVPRATFAALLLEADPLCLGVYAGPDESGVNLLAGNDWLRKKLEQLPSRP